MASSVLNVALIYIKSLKKEKVVRMYEQRSFYKGVNILLMLKYVTY